MNDNIRIFINSLGPVRDAELRFTPFMLFTGPSGLGKSYTAFLPYYLVNIFTGIRLLNFFEDKLKNVQPMPGTTTSLFSFKVEDLRLWMNKDVKKFISDMIGNPDFTCDVNFFFEIGTEKIDVSVKIPTENEGEALSEFAVIYVNEVPLSFPMDYLSKLHLPVNVALEFFFSKKLFGKKLRSILFPPARGAFIGANFTMQRSVASIGMYREFLEDMDYIRSSRPRKNDTQFFESVVSPLLNGRLLEEKGDLYLELPKNEGRIPMTAAASSIKELAPLFLLLQNSDDPGDYSILFEEPEAHLHPQMQHAVADLLTRCLNRGMFLQVTTHSDYFLSRLNQLIRLGRLREKNLAQFEAYCEQYRHNKNLFLDSSVISTYYFKREESGLVSIEEQDITDGVPFTSFRDIVEEQYREGERIESFFNEE